MAELTDAKFEIVANRYGKSKVRLLKVTRAEGRSDVHEWTVQVLLRGDFETAHTVGDNSKIVTTDTMKNTVYSLARWSSATTMEEFAEELIEHLLRRNEQVSSVRVHIEAALWKRLTVDGKEHPDTFMRGSNEVQTATVEQARAGEKKFIAGFANLQLLKTANSAFSGFQRDELTTLPETRDRVFGTAVDAKWTYSGPVEFAAMRKAAREVMLKVFADHMSESVQHTLYAMADAALEAVAEITEIELAMPNKHCLLVDLSKFGQDNPNQIFVPTDEPHGYIEARVRRK
ncbi:factor-independent urate hydroxylase [Granulicella tundricola]|uniref:Uricase n=1 Tax=Granulicella tundricola (strain ATCC BAA-1859 / DSM 23138 / MP5ACTX9) TaxID=1198114 RepID=E8WYY0_GRATM|nr:urate oxidase [Granulicella tundricola]ADW69895.1 urate oxidase [Granulicella tundricola MP5ACTX9]